MAEGLTNNSVFDGMIWWIGQIADDSTWRDNQLPGKFKDADTIPGWGYRYKVRIMGVDDHGPKDSDPIPEDQLRWANIMYPVTAGGGQGGSRQTPNLRQGNIVFGFWLDGNDQQVPIIMGVLGNNSQTALAKEIGKAEEQGVTNTQSGSIAKSGFPNKQEVEKTAEQKPLVPDNALQTSKPTTKEQAQECAPSPPGVQTNKFGLRPDISRTTAQQADLESALAEAEAQGLTGQAKEDFKMAAVAAGIKNRCGAAQSPLTPPQPGAEIESADNPHRLTADDVKAHDKACECIVTPLQQEDTVAAATKRIQIETDNLTQKVDKMLGAMKNYIDAVSGPPSAQDIQKEVRTTACKISKFQKIIMDKMGEYQNKKMNLALTTVVAAMPSSLRYMFADQKFLNTENTTKEYNEMTNGLCDQMEGILTAALDIPNLISQAQAQSTSGALWADANSASSVASILDLGGGGGSGGGAGGGAGGGGGSGSSDGSVGGGSDDVTEVPIPDPNKPRTPKVPMCYAEDIVAQGIAVNKEKINTISDAQHKNYNRFLESVKRQLEQTDREQVERAEDMSMVGKVTSITDEAPAAAYEPIGGSNYYSQNQVACSGGSGSGFSVDIKVGSGGWYDNGFATINDGGAGYYVNTANGGGVSGTGTTTAVTTTGGSGSGIKVDYTIASGVITGITTNTAGSNYKDGDVLTINQGATAPNPTTYATFTVNKVRGTIDRLKNDGIKINNAGLGYKMGDILVIDQPGSGQNAAVMINQVLDYGSAKATAGPVTPADNQGANGRWVPPLPPNKPPVNPMEKLGDMLSMLGGISGNVTQALDFVNLPANVFPFEPPPNTAVSDCYTLATGGQGVDEPNIPTSSVIDKAVAQVKSVAPGIPPLDFAIPDVGAPPINLANNQAISDLSELGAAAVEAENRRDRLAQLRSRAAQRRQEFMEEDVSDDIADENAYGGE